MSSLAFSIGTVNPRKFSVPNARVLLIKNSNSTETSNIRFSSHPQKSPLPPLQTNVNPTLSRREALGFSFCFGFLNILLQPEASKAAEAAACELTVAPSGLAFCDKVVGTGTEAAKGQLIKVICSFIFLF